MKRLIITLMAAILLASCVEKEEMVPGNLVQFEVECVHCLVAFTDNAFEKSIVVSGRIVYEFENKSLENVYLHITKSAHMAPIPVRAVIRQGGRVLELWEGELDWDEVMISAELR